MARSRPTLQWSGGFALLRDSTANLSDLRDQDDSDLAEALWRQFRARELTAALAISEELSRRLDAEEDPAIAAWLAEILLTTAQQVAAMGQGSALRVIARILVLQGQTLRHWIMHASRDRRVRDLGGVTPSAQRRVLCAVVGWSWFVESEDLFVRVSHSVRIYESLIARFADDTDPDVRGIATRAQINLGVMLFALGRYRAAVVAFNQYFSIEEASIAAVLRSARQGSDGAYQPTDVAAAMLAKTMPTGGQQSSMDTLAKATEILDADGRHARGKLQRYLSRIIAGFDPPAP